MLHLCLVYVIIIINLITITATTTTTTTMLARYVAQQHDTVSCHLQVSSNLSLPVKM